MRAARRVPVSLSRKKLEQQADARQDRRDIDAAAMMRMARTLAGRRAIAEMGQAVEYHAEDSRNRGARGHGHPR